MKTIIRKLIIIGASILIAACGGGGGGSTSGGGGSGDQVPTNTTTPTSPTQTFSLAKLSNVAEGTIFSAQLRGSDSNGDTLSGSLLVANRAKETLNGVLVTPRDMIINISNGSSSSTVTATGYMDTDGNLILIEVQTTGVTCTPATPDRLPDTVKIDDFGILSSLICSDGTTQTRNWRVEDAGNNTIRIITNSVVKDQYGTILSNTDVAYVIDAAGNVVGFSSTTELSSGYSMTYEAI